MNKKFKNFCLSNDEIENVIKQIEHFININCYIDGEFNEDLKQEICFEIFLCLSKNRKK